MIGQTVSHYRIVDTLGEGGMGVVYKAEDTKLNRTVALKFVRMNALDTEAHTTRFLNEAKAAAALDHPNICTVYAIEQVDRQAFLAMAFLEGQTLHAKITERPLKLSEVLDIDGQIGQALRAAHDKGIVHRDVKPANVMITDAGLVKLMDFGLAHLADRTRITQMGARLGTPACMSPEQAQGEAVDARSHIWSLGVVLYEMVSGRTPFARETEAATLYAILQEEPEPLTALRSGLPLELDRIIAKALAKSPEDRYQHISDLLVDLRTIRRGVDSAAPRTASLSRSHLESRVERDVGKSRSRFPVRWLAAMVTIAIASAALTGVIADRGAPRGPAPRVLRYSIDPPPKASVYSVAQSPDGGSLRWSPERMERENCGCGLWINWKRAGSREPKVHRIRLGRPTDGGSRSSPEAN
jgi:serine/threonine protein kinase